ncbi:MULTISPECIES: hypothetical protein [unclassified Nocardia]|uniref:hypothetical protein n=1 Tax=unclassified Nocardia TaxID=2637762 RepID=UPI001CE3F56A|nr:MULTISPECIES: hypothetical protein [unclassified Nocardia]
MSTSTKRPRRMAALTAVAMTAMAATVTFAPQVNAATADSAPPENASAGSAIATLTADGAISAPIPADFATEFGYRPAVVDGLLVNPQGDCSSPIPLPAEFDTACKAHDLGYDLLRYAGQHGEPLGPWARQAVDAALARRMHESCGARSDLLSRAHCDVMASVANIAVDLNSLRQDYGTPIVEKLFGTEVSGTDPTTMAPLLAILGTGMLGFWMLVRLLIGALRRINPIPAAAQVVSR